MSPTSFLAIVLATFASEDLTCITVGLLLAEQRLDWFTGLSGCYVGILAGDLGLWLLGALAGRRLIQLRYISRRLPPQRLEAMREWYSRRGWQTVVAARFIPGARFPVYVGAGLLGRSATTFLLWAALAGVAWTPLLVGLVALLGPAVVAPLQQVLRWSWLAVAAAVIVLYGAIHFVRRFTKPFEDWDLRPWAKERRRARWVAAVSRLWRWEFWPAWLFYLPLVPYFAYLALRHRGLTVSTAANPGIPLGGVVGESKYEILKKLPKEWVVETERIDAGPPADRIRQFQAILQSPSWRMPVILKPDVGERGAGLRLIQNVEEGLEVLASSEMPYVVQGYHPGPFEAGVFYVRMPGSGSGRIFSITDKQFPLVQGDGEATLEMLIWRDPRLRMQAAKFLARHAGRLDQVLAVGETLRLAAAGNHCQGTLFRDGSHLWSAELERRFDDIARAFEGFYFGRFDVRYTEAEAFRAGRDFAIVELNGVSSESTNLYDPAHSLWQAYRILFRQWRVLFEIGARNRDRGYQVTPPLVLLRAIRVYYRERTVSALAD